MKRKGPKAARNYPKSAPKNNRMKKGVVEKMRTAKDKKGLLAKAAQFEFIAPDTMRKLGRLAN